jgi:DNA replication ATP-dependent helicase Dna2
MLPGQVAEEYLDMPSDTGHSGFKREVAANRVLFLDIRSGDVNFTKMNDEEASCIHSLLLDLYDLYQSSGRRLEDVSIGVITPFRAQIVKIKSLIENLPFRINVTVDTVERFQGGSQDIVIISTVVSSHTLSSSIISTSWEGIDRKMNVALTRARERLIMVGNKSILQQLPYYKEFVERYGV